MRAREEPHETAKERFFRWIARKSSGGGSLTQGIASQNIARSPSSSSQEMASLNVSGRL
jgi:hypothetical protein